MHEYPSSVHISLFVDLLSIALVVDSVIPQVHVELSEAQRIGTIREMLIPPKATDPAIKAVTTLTASAFQTERILTQCIQSTREGPWIAADIRGSKSTVLC